MEQTFMKEKKIIPLVLSMSLPMMLSMLVNSLYNIVDSYFVAQISEQAMTALSLVYPLQLLETAIAVGFGIGINAAAAFYLGAGERKNANDVVTSGILLSIVHGIVLTLFSIGFARYFVGMFTDQQPILEDAVKYAWIVFAFTIPNVVAITFEKIFQAEGRMKVSMISMLCGCVVNIILDPVFIFGLGQGAAGAAMATVIGNVIADVYYIYVMNKKAKRLSVSLKEIKIPGTMIRDILVIGIPASITNLMQSIMIMITNHYLIAYGTDKVAAMGIALKANMISAFILVGFAFGGQPLVGYNYGARNKKRLKEILRFAYLFEAGLALVFTISISVFAPAIIKIFMNQSDIITNGAMMLRFQQLGMVFMAVTLVSTCVCQSVGSAAGAFALSISRQGVLYAISLMVLNAIFGYTGIIATQACADVLTAVIALAIIRKVLGGMKNEIQYDRV